MTAGVLPRLLVLTDRRMCEDAGRSLEATVEAAVQGGTQAVVLREKDLPATARIALGRRLLEVGAVLVVASDPTVAEDLGADWIHLAAGDPVPPVGAPWRWSRSCHTAADVARAAAGGAAAVTISPVFLTASKPGYGPAIGTDGVGDAVTAAGAGCPVYALGGISVGNAGSCLGAGANGVAVMGAVMAAADPASATRALVDVLHMAAGAMTPPVALTIAGSDSGGGAGIQADLKTFAALGVFGTSAITALTAQSTTAVTGVHVPPTAFLDQQLDAVLADFDVRAVKTGMLATTEVIATVARRAASGALPNLVIDPVLTASSGALLLEAGAERAYADLLFPHTLVITPNLREAALLVGRPLATVDDMVAAALEMRALGPKFVIVKGGHLEHGDAVDVLFDGDDVTLLRAAHVPSANTHGTGCTFASAITAGLAHGVDVLTAARAAKDFVTTAIAGAADWHLGAGHGPLDHFGWSHSPEGTLPGSA